MKLNRVVVSFFVLGASIGAEAQGDLIGVSSMSEVPIANNSFENPILADGVVANGSVPGWTNTGSEVAVANPANNYFSGTTDQPGGVSPLHGLNAASCNLGSKLIYNVTNLAIQPNTIYRLDLLAGHRIGVPFGNGSASFWAGTDLIARAFANPPADQFVPVSLVYTSPPSGNMIGKALRIELTTEGAGAQAWFDDLHLYSGAGFIVCTPHKATATATLVNGVFVGATITDSGCGYTNPPIVLIKGGGGAGATASAVLSDGRVTEILVTNGGCCYTNIPQVVIGSPPFVPVVSISVSKVNVTQSVVLGWKYVLESSTNHVNWTPTGPEFVADSEIIVQEFDVSAAQRFFRLRVVP